MVPGAPQGRHRRGRAVTRGARRYLVALVHHFLCDKCGLHSATIGLGFYRECHYCRERRVLGMTLKDVARGGIRPTSAP
jgi:hypothetical protein